MVIAGIDEAGYGPLLGPLVVGCCAFEAPGEGQESPCLWKLLRRLVSKSRDRKGRKLHINDSKAVYSASVGLKELERSVLSVAMGMGLCSEELPGLLERVAPGAWGELKCQPWYRAFEGERFPIEHEAVAIRLCANALSAEMQRTGARCVHLSAKVMSETVLNRQLQRTHNKSSVLFSLAACHLDHLLRTYGHMGLVVFCDRQGGREHYGRLLRLMFEDWALEVRSEADGVSEYGLSRGGHVVRVVFAEKAEAQCLPVAMASMLSKYLREALMRRFNAYWRGLLPELEPTAGYYADGMRFLKDIEAVRRGLGVADEQLIRAR